MGAAASIRITVDLPEALHKRLKLQAANSGQRVADLVRGWVESHCPDYDAWFLAQVDEGIAACDAGDVSSGDELKRRDQARRDLVMSHAARQNQSR
ncbi:MAG: hypothetical protein Q7J29_03480 [Stagnimonas sp.]|nr:hypothetical protein [Stagnimonas sp.]